MSKGTTSQDAPFGTLLGYAPGGVAIYSSDYSSLDPRDYDDDAAFRSYIDDEYMGHKWQCVEFARRFLFLNPHCRTERDPHAAASRTAVDPRTGNGG